MKTFTKYANLAYLLILTTALLIWAWRVGEQGHTGQSVSLAALGVCNYIAYLRELDKLKDDK